MKNRLFINTCLLYLLITGAALSAMGQGSISFNSGIKVNMKSETIPPTSNPVTYGGLSTLSTKDGKDIYHRILTDPENSIYYGYDVEVSRSTEADKFLVAIKPLSYKPEPNDKLEKLSARPLPKYPEEVVVRGGDLIKLEILENPKTKAKVIDYYKVGETSKPFDTAFTEQDPASDFTIDDVHLKLDKFDVFADGKKIGQVRGSTWGSNVFFAVPGKGRFIISPFPREGYNFQKIGTIIDNKLSFTQNGEKYEVITNAAILGEGGHWNVWVMYDADYKWKSNPSYPLSIQFGAADKVAGLFIKRKESM